MFFGSLCFLMQSFKNFCCCCSCCFLMYPWDLYHCVIMWHYLSAVLSVDSSGSFIITVKTLHRQRCCWQPTFFSIWWTKLGLDRKIWKQCITAVFFCIFIFSGCETEVYRAGEEREVTPWATESAEVRGRLQHQGICSTGAGHYNWSTGASYRVSHDSQLWVGEGVCMCWWRERE